MNLMMPFKYFRSALSRKHTARKYDLRMLSICAVITLLLVACGEPTPANKLGPNEIARQTIADFLSLPVTDTTLVSSEANKFNDASLGCPEPGMSYAQAITPGHRIVIEADGRRFDVRVAGTHGRICRRNAKNPPSDYGSSKPADRPPPITSMRDQQPGPILAI